MLQCAMYKDLETHSDVQSSPRRLDYRKRHLYNVFFIPLGTESLRYQRLNTFNSVKYKEMIFLGDRHVKGNQTFNINLQLALGITICLLKTLTY